MAVGGGNSQTGNCPIGDLMNFQRSQGSTGGTDGFEDDFSLSGGAFHSWEGICGSLPALRQSRVCFFKSFTSVFISENTFFSIRSMKRMPSRWSTSCWMQRAKRPSHSSSCETPSKSR